MEIINKTIHSKMYHLKLINRHKESLWNKNLKKHSFFILFIKI